MIAKLSGSSRESLHHARPPVVRIQSVLGIDSRAARATWTALLVVLLLAFIYLIRSTLFVFILALLFAYLLSPLVNLLDRFLPTSRTRTPALALAYIIFVALVAFLGFEIGSRVAEEGTKLTKEFPEMIAKWKSPDPNWSAQMNQIKAEIVERIQQAISSRTSDLIASAAQAGLKALAVASTLVYVVIIPILGFFFLKDGRKIRLHILEMFEGPRRALIDDVMADIHLLLAHYMRTLVVLSLAALTAYTIFFAIVGVPYAILLGALGGLLEFIPMLGPLVAGTFIVIVAAITGSHALLVLAFLLLYRLFQDYMLSPHLMGQGVELHPLLVLFGVFAGAEFAGIAGTFLSVPVLALVRILYLRARRARIRAELAPGPEVELTK